ncbi:MAG: hypothetical protein RLY65_1756, partial [Pseudomonadota bacterium]
RVDDPVQIEVNPTALKTFGGE